MRWFVATLGWIILLIILWIVIGKPLPAFGHDNYPPDCCDGTDCAVVPCGDIKQLSELKWQHGEAVFGANNVRKPRDDTYLGARITMLHRYADSESCDETPATPHEYRHEGTPKLLDAGNDHHGVW